jgi:WD40 repeat protein
MKRRTVALLVCCWLVPAVPAPAQTTPPHIDAAADPLPAGAFARLGTLRYRHSGKLLLGFTADDQSFLFHSELGTLHWMDVATGKHTKTVRYRDAVPIIDAIVSGPQAVLSGDGKRLVYHDRGREVFGIVDMATGKELRRIAYEHLWKGNATEVRAYGLSDDGMVLVVRTSDSHASPLVWANTSTGQRLHTVEPPKDTSWEQAEISRDGKYVVALARTRLEAGALHVFETATGQLISSVKVGSKEKFRFLLRGDGKTLVGLHMKDELREWRDPLSEEGPLQLADMTGKQLKELHPLGKSDGAADMALSRDDRSLFVRSTREVTHWDLATGKQVRALDIAPAGRDDDNYFERTSDARALVVSHNGKWLAVAGQKWVTLFDTATGTRHNTTGAAFLSLGFAPDGKGLVTAAVSKEVKLWSVKQLKELHTLASPAKGGDWRVGIPLLGDFNTTHVGFSADGRYVAVGLQEGVQVWDAATGKHLHHLGANPKNPERSDNAAIFAFAPTGHLLAVASIDGTVQLWDAASGEHLRQWTWAKVQQKKERKAAVLCHLAFSPDGKTLAGCGAVESDLSYLATLLVLWETATGGERLQLRNDIGMPAQPKRDHPYSVFFQLLLMFDQVPMGLTYAPDGKSVALATFSNLHLIDAATGQNLQTFPSWLAHGRTAVFSKDSKLLFVGRHDGGLRILDVATTRGLRDLPAHEDSVTGLVLSPDGKTLASCSADATVLLWDVAEITKPVSVAKAALTVQELEVLWLDLAGPVPAKAYQAILRLAAAPAEAAPFLQARLTPVPPLPPQVLTQLFADLDSNSLALREKAALELENLGDFALVEVRKRLAAKPSLEMRQRLEKLLTKLTGPTKSPALLQTGRAVEALERMGTPEALVILETLATGTAGHRTTEDAHAAAQRLKGKQ